MKLKVTSGSPTLAAHTSKTIQGIVVTCMTWQQSSGPWLVYVFIHSARHLGETPDALFNFTWDSVALDFCRLAA